MKIVQALLLVLIANHLLGCVASSPIEKPPVIKIDTDHDGLSDDIDLDDDNDGTADLADKFPLDPKEQGDFDGDGIGDNADLDDDNDGTTDLADKFPFDAKEQKDLDGDGIGDNADLDDDNDGTPDLTDKFPIDPKEQEDFDGDGIGNNADLDDDNDGASDLTDKFPFDPKEQKDFDGDGTGDNADLDDDNDGTPDLTDKFPFNAKEQKDFDSDGTGDIADQDDDNDGVADLVDKFPFDKTEQKDFDADGVGDNADTDDDNDSIADSIDTFLKVSFELDIPMPQNAILLSDAQHNRLFIVDPDKRRLWVIDQSNGSLISTRALRGRPASATIAPDNSTLFVALSNTSTGKGSVVVFDTQSVMLKSTFDIEVDPFSIVATHDNKLVVSAQNTSSPMTLIDTNTQTIQQIPPYFSYTTHLAMDPQDRWIYANPTDSLYPIFTFNIFNNGSLYSPKFITTAKRIWPAPDGKYVFINNYANEFGWIPVGEGVLTAFPNTLKNPPFNQPVRDVVFDPQAPIAAIVLNDYSIHLINLETMEVFKSFPSSNIINAAILQDEALIKIETDESSITFLTKEQHPCPNCKSNSTPAAHFTIEPEIGNANQAISLDASSSRDLENEPMMYRWDFESDGAWDTEFSTLPTITHTYITPGTYEVKLQIKDAFTQLAVVTKKIDIKPVFQSGTPIAPGIANSFTFTAQNGFFDGKSTSYYIDPKSKKLYLTDLSTGQATKFFTTNGVPTEITPSVDRTYLYILQEGENGDSFISTIDLDTQLLISTVKIKAKDTGKGKGKVKKLLDGNSGHWVVINTDNSISYVEKQTGAITYIDRSSDGNIFTPVNEQGDKFYSLNDYFVQPISTNPDDAIYGFEGIELNKPFFFGGDIKSSWFTPDGSIIIGDTGRIYNLNTKDSYSFFEGGRIIKVQFDVAKKLLITLNDDGRVHIYNLSSFQLIETLTSDKPAIDIITINGRLYTVNTTENGGSTLNELPYPSYDCSSVSPPQITLSNLTASNKIGSLLTLQANASTNDVADTLLYRWDLNGDGKWDTQFDRSNTRSQTFLAPGQRTVSVQVRNNLGGINSASITLDIANAEIHNVPAIDEPTANNLFPKIKPGDRVLLPNSNIIVVSDSETHQLHFVDITTSKVIKSLYTDFYAGKLTVSPSGNALYLLLYGPQSIENNEYTTSIGRIDLKTFTLTNVFPSPSVDTLEAISDTQIVAGKVFGNNLALMDGMSGAILNQVYNKQDGDIIVLNGGQGVLVDHSQYYRVENGALQLTIDKYNPYQYMHWLIPGEKWVLDSDFGVTEISTLNNRGLLGYTAGGYITSAVFSEDGKVGFATISNKTLIAFNTETLAVIKSIENWGDSLIGYRDNQLLNLNYSYSSGILTLGRTDSPCEICTAPANPQ